jgi:hypothetical protein
LKAAGRTPQEIDEGISAIIQGHDFAVGVLIEPPGQSATIKGQRFSGRPAWNGASFVDANELWRLLEEIRGWSRDVKAQRTVSPSSNKAKTGCLEALTEAMKQSPARRSKRKDDWFEEMRKRFPGLSRHSFDVAWDQAVDRADAPAWTRGGRPKSRN